MPSDAQYGNQNTTIYHGDSLGILSQLKDESVDLIFADPPYNIGKRFGEFKDVWSSDEEYVAWCYKMVRRSIVSGF